VRGNLILITGGAGFIGSHTIEALLARGDRVRILDNLDQQVHGEHRILPDRLDSEIELVNGDVRDAATVDECLLGVDRVLHLASLTGVGQSMYDLRDYTDVNVTGTANLLERIARSRGKVRRLVLSSSRAVYGEGTFECSVCGVVFPQGRAKRALESGDFAMYCPRCHGEVRSVPTTESRPLRPLSIYGWTKRCQEELCLQASDISGIPVTILRYFNVYGPRQSLVNPYTGIVSIFYARIIAGKPISIYENGVPARDFVHVSDVVAANLAALDQSEEGCATINVGTGMATTVAEVARSLGRAVDRQPTIEVGPEYRAGDIHSCVAETARMRELVGSSARVSLDEGLDEFARWASGQASIDRYDNMVEEMRRHGLFGSSVDE
jgi:dTDP-L-rhamnose 4-epimerase